jgi:uncharacterized protein YkuJ
METSEISQVAQTQTKSLTIGKDKTTLNDGEVLVSKGSGKIKVRKGQTEDEYQKQKEQFEKEGPVINTLKWLEDVDIGTLDPLAKSDRLKLENLSQMLYYKRQYQECLKVVNAGIDLFKDLPRKRIQTEWSELEYLKEQCEKKIAS